MEKKNEKENKTSCERMKTLSNKNIEKESR